MKKITETITTESVDLENVKIGETLLSNPESANVTVVVTRVTVTMMANPENDDSQKLADLRAKLEDLETKFRS